jgi:hypothetical protein
MRKELQYIIYVRKFRGLLMADLKGMYLSSYKNKDGEKRYEIEFKISMAYLSGFFIIIIFNTFLKDFAKSVTLDKRS